MVGSATDTEYLLAHKTAEEYRSKGYEVFEDQPLDFLPGFRADLIVRKDDETKVIEVKSRSSLSADPKISELARIIDLMPGWSFDLVLVGEPEKVDSPDGSQTFGSKRITYRIEEAEKALGAGFPEAAFVLAWSACEAAARFLVAAEGVSSTGITTSGYVLDQAVYRGVISRSEYEDLTDMQKYRNAIVHGFSIEEFSSELVTELIEIVKSLLRRHSDMPVGSASS